MLGCSDSARIDSFFPLQKNLYLLAAFVLLISYCSPFHPYGEHTQFYRKNTFGVCRLSIYQSGFSSVDKKTFFLLASLTFFHLHLLWYHSFMHFSWRFILASCLQSLFLHSFARQAEPLGFHNTMFCPFLLFWKETACCPPTFLISFFVHLFCSCTFSVSEAHYMRQWYVSQCVIHEGVSQVSIVQMIISVN